LTRCPRIIHGLIQHAICQDEQKEIFKDKNTAKEAPFFKTLLYYLMTAKIRVKGLTEVKHEAR